MKGYVYVGEAGTAEDEALAAGVAMCRDYALTLPGKTTRPNAR
jgi:hypothetical protein